MRHARPLLRLQHALLACLWAANAAVAAAWPQIAMPPGVRTFTVGEQIAANGLPMRVQGFVVKDMEVAALADWFRRSLGQPLVEDRLGNKLILGRAQEGYYLSVQLEAAGPDGRGGSRGLLAVSDLLALNQGRDSYEAKLQRWMQRWPSGSQVISRTSSTDRGRAALHVVLQNGHSESLNREALIDVMKQDGFALAREASAEAALTRQAQALPYGGKAYFFNGNGKEAIATIARDGQGHTTVVLNTSATLEGTPE